MRYTIYRFLTFSLLLLAFIGCKKDITALLPEGQPSVAFNFYSASDVMVTAYGKDLNATMLIYVDKMQTSGIPFLYYFPFTGGGNEFPALTSGSSEINYVNYVSGGHRMMFTDSAHRVVLDTTITQPQKSYNCLYFTDVQTAYNAPAAYEVVAVQEPRSVPSGKMGVRFVHLSPDAGTLVCSRQKADGTLTNALPADLHFREASAYQYFDPSDAVNGLLTFQLNNPANGASVITGVPYTPGRSYVVVVSGFYNDQQRMVSFGSNPDGSINYQTITIPRNLRGIPRISY